MQIRTHKFRRRYYLPGSIQSRLLRRLTIWLILAILVSASLFYIFAGQEVADEFYKAHQTVKHTREMFLPWLIGANILALVLAVIFAIIPCRGTFHPNLGPQIRVTSRNSFTDSSRSTSKIMMRLVALLIRLLVGRVYRRT